MKTQIARRLHLLCSILPPIACFLAACDNDVVITAEELIEDSMATHPMHQLMTQRKDTLRIFAIGNSYTLDPTYYLSSLVDCTEIPADRWCVYGVTANNASLSYWWKSFVDGTALDCTIQYGGLAMESYGTLAELLSQSWDIISFQQVSYLSYNYSSFFPELDFLISTVRRLCPNPDVQIAWQQTWSYDDNFGNALTCEQMYQGIAAATTQLFSDGSIDILIPTGTAIQNARSTSLNTPHNLTRDGTHLCQGVGLYIGACTWFQTLFAPVFDVTILGNPATHRVSDTERWWDTPYEPVDVTSENRELCQQCAFEAVYHPFEITIIDENSTAL